MSQIRAKQIHTLTICGCQIIDESIMIRFKVVPKFSSQKIIPDQITLIVDVKLPSYEKYSDDWWIITIIEPEL